MTLEDESLQDQTSVPSQTRIQSWILLIVFVVGLGGGYFMGRESMKTETASGVVAIATPTAASGTDMMHEVNPPDGYTIPVKFGEIGPSMLAAGAIDLAKFIQLYEQVGRPLNSDQLDILQKGSNIEVTINQNNAHFLLNFFWAFGLVNENEILKEGPMMANGAENVGGFASTGGWTLGTQEPTKLYASSKIISLTEEQQKKLLEVATAVYRPCCNNPTHFPDCNHGMAMLGLLELMASQNASVDQMFEAAKYVTAFWYPQQMLEVATALKATQKVSFADADSRLVVSDQLASGSGFKAVHQWLATNGLLEQAPSSGGGCGVQ
jgi:hypothetical protein